MPVSTGDAQRIEQMAWMLFLKVYDEKQNDGKRRMIINPLFLKNAVGVIGLTMMEAGNALTGDDLLIICPTMWYFDKLTKIEITPDTPIRQAIVRTVFEDANQYMKDGVQLRQVLNVIDDLDLGNYEESHAFR